MVHQNTIPTPDDFLYSCHLSAWKRNKYCYENLEFGHHLSLLGGLTAAFYESTGIHESLLKRSTFTAERKAFIVPCNK